MKLENVLIIGGAGYLAYTLFSSLSKKKGGENNDGVAPIPTVKMDTYEDKVKAIQTALNLSVDGIAGKKTNGTLEMLWSKPYKVIDFETSFKAGYPNLKKNGKGVLSADNVDYYVDALRNKTYPSFSYGQSVSTVKLANKVREAYKNGGVLRVLNAGSRFNEVRKDLATGNWVRSGKVLGYDKNATFVVPEWISRAKVRIVDVTTLGNLIIEVSPTFGTNTFLSVPSGSVFVDAN